MPVTTRGTAEQGSTVRLTINIKKNGEFSDPYSIGTGADILDTVDTIVASGLTIVQEDTGIYYVDYPIAQDATVGTWSDVWRDIVYNNGQTPVDVTLSFIVQLGSWQTTAPDICRVYEFLYELDADPVTGAEGTAKILNMPYTYESAYYTNDAGLAYSDSSGKIVWDLVYGAKINIKIPSVGINKNFLVPSSPTAQLKDITAI